MFCLRVAENADLRKLLISPLMKSKMKTMKLQIDWPVVEKRKVKDLKLWDNNPRTLSKEAFGKLKDRIIKRGFHDVVKLNLDGRIISGNQRKRALEELGVEEVFVMLPERLLTDTEMQIVAGESNLHDGEDDFDMLANLYTEETLREIGYSEIQLGKMGIGNLEEDDFDAGAAYAEIQEPNTKIGDVFKLGSHRLMCGNSELAADFEKLMVGDLAQLIFTDPPYSVDYGSSEGNSYAKGKYQGKKIFNDDKSDEEALSFYKNVLNALAKVSKDDAVLYWWFANQKNWLNRLAWIEAGWRQSQIIIWVKNSMIFSSGQMYHRCYEPCMVGWKEKGTHWHNKQLPNLKDVFNLEYDEFSDQLDVWFERRDKITEYVHPTQKPVRLAERALRKNSREGDIVLDAFGGSGSTLIACEQMGRCCRMMELDPKYCDVIIARWEKLTGLTAEKVS